MELFLQRLLDGTSNGAIYAVMALAIVLVFISTGTLNIALGAMGMFCTFTAWYIWSPEHLGAPLGVAVAAAILIGFIGGAGLERVVVRPVEKDTDHLRVVIVTLGLLLAIESLAGHLFTVDTVALDPVFPSGSFDLGPARMTYGTLGLIATVLLVGFGMYAMFRFTRIGLAMRASVDNPDSARLSGVKGSQMLMFGWALSGALATVAGILVSPTTSVHTGMLNNALFLGFAAAAFGGFTSPFGAMIGGWVMGLVEVMAPAYVPFLSNQLALLSVFAVMLVVLLVKPSGLFGRAEAQRV